MIRSVIFNNILDHARLPKESASAFKVGFYKIILRPFTHFIKKNWKFFAHNLDKFPESTLEKLKLKLKIFNALLRLYPKVLIIKKNKAIA